MIVENALAGESQRRRDSAQGRQRTSVAVGGGPIFSRCKAAFEFLLALFIMLGSTPVVLVAGLLVKLTSRGPVFYSQTRVGRNGKPFTIYKIRTMINNCEVLTGARWSIPGDPRVTPVGWFLRRTHIDELPQLWNVLRGEMSLVGPRPERPEFVPRLEETIANYSDRLLVKPGLTGLAQVQLPPDTDLASVQRKLAYDLYYIQHAGFWLEAKIYVATALHLVAVPFPMIRLLCALPLPEVIEAGYHQLRLRSSRSRDNNGDQQFVRRAVS